MNSTQRVGLGLGIMALLATAAGCGSSSGGGFVGAAKAPSAEAPGPSTGASPGYGQSAQLGSYPSPMPAAETMGDSAPSSVQPSAPPPPPSQPSSSAAAGMARADIRELAKAAPDKAARRAEPEPNDRPGLGTEWGETRFSRITTVPFVRADVSNPSPPRASSTTTSRARATWPTSAASVASRRAPSPRPAGSSRSPCATRAARFLSGFAAGGKSYVVGEAGRRYIIVVHNNTDNRLEIVLSVDGLDVLDGKAASFNKRGYLVDPRADVEIDGFRQSVDTVAAFRFGSVRGSYASQKTGDARNVGVIGVAIFNERGTNPFNSNSDEAQRRRDANPFPGQFATPP